MYVKVTAFFVTLLSFKLMREMLKIINEKEDCNEFQLCFVCMFVSLSSVEHELVSILQGSYSTDLFV